MVIDWNLFSSGLELVADDVDFGVTLALAGLGLARRVLSLADDVCDRGVEQEGCGVGA